MTSEELTRIISQPEGLKLDFKREYKLARTPPDGMDIDVQDWAKYREGQWNELIKDILALANGNIGTSGQKGILVIGVGDELMSNGARRLYDTSHLQLDTQQILAKVNSASNPPFPDLICKRVDLNGKSICVITIPPSPHIYETTRQLNTFRLDFDDKTRRLTAIKDKSYTAQTVFIRRGENIYPATDQERQALMAEKRSEITRLIQTILGDLSPRLLKFVLLYALIGIGAMIGIFWASTSGRWGGIIRATMIQELTHNRVVQSLILFIVCIVVFLILRVFRSEIEK